MTDERAMEDGSCLDDYDRSLRVQAARDRILGLITPLRAHHTLPLRAALGRVLAEDIQSPLDVPNHDNSAMDGYAVRGADLPAQGAREFTVTGSALAGRPCTEEVAPGCAIRIMTGAALPPGADTVVMQEKAEILADDRIRIGGGHLSGQHTRRRGEDITRGSRVATRGHRLSAADLGVLASLGIAEVRVRRRPRVALFTTGDELRSLGEALEPGAVHDSNRYTLYGMLRELDVEIHDLGVVRDDPAALRTAFGVAAALGDVVLSSGGVSVGTADHIRDVIAGLGHIEFWKIAIKPGRPLACGRLGDALFFGLPGNPVAVMVTFQQFVAPALHYLASGQVHRPLVMQATATGDLRKQPGRFEFQRGILSYDAHGKALVASTGQQGSGILTSMSRANCFILLDEERGPVRAGEPVTVQPFPHLGLHGLD